MENKALLNYLSNLSSQLYLPERESEKIRTSLKTIKDKLVVDFFDYGLKEVKPFGSFDRQTLLSRTVDSESDVDILIVFDEKRWEAQTYLNKLKQFATDNYTRADNYQDHPTIVLELNPVKFELTPCIHVEKAFLVSEKYLIPKKQGSDIEWITTEPDQLKDKIGEFTTTKKTLLDVIHLMKYLNVLANKPYSTFRLENFVITNFDWEENHGYNFFKMIDNLDDLGRGDIHGEFNDRLQKHKSKIKLLLSNDMEEYAIMELSKLLPEIS
jgi:predicted nucleotidyltransferase